MASGASPPRGMDERRHLARDEHAIKLLDALNATWTLVDARWTPNTDGRHT